MDPSLHAKGPTAYDTTRPRLWKWTWVVMGQTVSARDSSALVMLAGSIYMALVGRCRVYVSPKWMGQHRISLCCFIAT